MKKYRCVISLFLTLMLCLSLLPVGAMAESEAPEDHGHSHEEESHATVETAVIEDVLEAVTLLSSECEHSNFYYHEADYTPCAGGWTVDVWWCQDCGASCDENGAELDPSVYYKEADSLHTPDLFVEPDFVTCIGGYKDGYYECAVCNWRCNEAGESFEPTYYQGDGVHDPGRRVKADYHVCSGGWTVDRYVCTRCTWECGADGLELDWDAYFIQGTHQHIPGEYRAADYTECLGGWTHDYHACAVCDRPCDENGEEYLPFWWEALGHDYDGSDVCTRCNSRLGDLDGDESLSAGDMVALMKLIAANDAESMDAIQNAGDLNKDGETDILDIIRLVQTVADQT